MRLASQGSMIRIAAPPPYAAPLSITAATKAKPCTITITGTAPVVGSIVLPTATGWKSIDNQPYKVSLVAAQVITLEDSDTTAEPAAIDTANGKINSPVFSEMCRSTFDLNMPAGSNVNVTTLCDMAQRVVAGLPGLATWTAAGFYDCQDAPLFVARDFYRSGDTAMLDITFPDGCGVCFASIINTFNITLGVNAAIANALGGQVDGRVCMYKTPPPAFVPRALPPPPAGDQQMAQAA